MYYTVCIMNLKLKWKYRQIFLSASAVLGVSQIPTTKMLNQNIFPTSYTMCKQNDMNVILYSTPGKGAEVAVCCIWEQCKCLFIMKT